MIHLKLHVGAVPSAPREAKFTHLVNIVEKIGHARGKGGSRGHQKREGSYDIIQKREVIGTERRHLNGGGGNFDSSN